MDSPGCMKHSYMTRNACTKQQDKKKWLAYSPYSAQSRHIQFVGGALYSELLNTLSFRLQPRTDSSNASNMLELHATLSTADLGTQAYMHVSCVRKLFCLVWVKKLSSLVLLAFFDLG